MSFAKSAQLCVYLERTKEDVDSSEGFFDPNLHPAFGGKRNKRLFPCCARILQRWGNRVCCSTIECADNCLPRFFGNQLIGGDQQHQIHEVANPAVWILHAWKHIRMNLLGKLRFAGNCRDSGRRDLCKSEPITRVEYLRRLHDDISDADIEVKSRKRPVCQGSLHRISCSSIGSAIQIRYRFADSIDKKITQI